jgi:hypothetical protein
VKAAAIGGGNIVLYAEDRRISMPGAEAWAGSERNLLLKLVDDALKARNVDIRRSVRAGFQYSRRMSRKSPVHSAKG